jgi:hypothetical protein
MDRRGHPGAAGDTGIRGRVLTDTADGAKLRILLAEGSSLSAREAITVLGLAGHHLELCDPDPRCIGRFSRFVRRFHRCPPMGSEPERFLDFTCALLERGGFDALLPVHEQAYLFAAARTRLPAGIGVALAPFASFERVQGKVEWSRLLGELSLPQPETRIAFSAAELCRCDITPAFIKTAFGTASRGIWRANDAGARAEVAAQLIQLDAFAEGIVVQRATEGRLERAQSVFDAGRLVAFHAYAQIAAGAGGGDAIKESIERPTVREHLMRIGAALRWHGAFSVDYIRGKDGTPFYIDANPRLVEPMNARRSGTDLAAALVQVSLGRAPATVPSSPAGIRTHLGVQALLGLAERGATRGQLLQECRRLWRRTGPYAGSSEELTPVALDPWSAIPVAIVLTTLLAAPAGGRRLSGGFARSHQLTLDTVRTIRRKIAGRGD